MNSNTLRVKTRLLAIVVILANVLGNFFLSVGLRKRGLGISPSRLWEALANPWVSLGICALILWMLSRMALLSWADLSYVLPITSSGYILAVLMGRLFLGEEVSPQRWAGAALITLGIVLVSRTSIRSSGGAR